MTSSGVILDLEAFFETVEAAKRPNTMLRWDACAPEVVKYRLSDGRPQWDQEILDLFTIDNSRSFDILFGYPGTDYAAWRRPWVKAAICENYPIEYRVFVHDGMVVGVSNYYVQRPLIDADGDPLHGVQADVRQVVAFARQMAAALPVPIRFGPAAKNYPPDSRSFTADFMRLETGDLVFLEAGPPFGANAHPCCFPADPGEWKDSTAHRLENVLVALADAKEASESEKQKEHGIR